jgi:hypothetical protein
MLDFQQAIKIMASADNFSESASAILLDADGRPLLQLRDNVSHIRDPGKISLFGGGREATRAFSTALCGKFTKKSGFICHPSALNSSHGTLDQITSYRKAPFMAKSSLRATYQSKGCVSTKEV